MLSGVNMVLNGCATKYLYGLADGILFYGRCAHDFFVEKGFDPSRLFIVNNSLNYDLQRAIANEIYR